MSKGAQRQKLIDALASFASSREATCPNCGSHTFELGYVETNRKDGVGFGAFWCKNCRIALGLCRANLKSREMREKIVSELPKDLKYI